MAGVLKYLSVRGRANRQRYWLTGLSIVGLVFVSALVSGALTILSPLLSVIVIPVWVALFVAGVTNGVRRLHDRGKTAWWLLVFYLLPILLSLPARVASYGTPDGFQAAAAFLALLGLPFSIWGFVQLGCLRGTIGPNEYGDDPIAPPVEAAFA